MVKSFIQENSENLIVQTRIGQLRLDKTLVKSINEVEPLLPNIIFNEQSIEEKLSKDNKYFSGTIFNTGGRRGDFIRVIYKIRSITQPDSYLVNHLS